MTATQPLLCGIDAGTSQVRALVFTLEGKVVASGEAQLSDKGYADHINPYPRDARWPYDMQMIDAWWRKTIVPLQTTGR